MSSASGLIQSSMALTNGQFPVTPTMSAAMSPVSAGWWPACPNVPRSSSTAGLAACSRTTGCVVADDHRPACLGVIDFLPAVLGPVGHAEANADGALAGDPEGTASLRVARV